MKPLRILLGNNTLNLLAGSETHTLTLANELKKKGHHVACFSPGLGIISDELKKNNIYSYDSLNSSSIKPFSFILEEKIDHSYDVIIANHFEIVEYLRRQFPKTPIISTIHGVIHKYEDGKKAPEHPALNSGVNQFVAVSEEVQKKLKDDYDIDSVIIRNFFDVLKFDEKKPINDKPKQFLVNTNYQSKNDPEIEVIREVAKHYGARLAAVGMNFTVSLDLTKAIEDSDIVVGMGRSVLEGVSAGRIGLVHGRWGTGGIVCEENIQALRYYNFSGRNSKGLGSAAEIIEMIDRRYNPDTVDWGKKYIRSEHNAALAADAYIALARELLGQNIVPVVSGQGANPDMPKLKFAFKKNE
jgi:hypothetical protein